LGQDRRRRFIACLVAFWQAPYTKRISASY
jgi:hypothetical protein